MARLFALAMLGLLCVLALSVAGAGAQEPPPVPLTYPVVFEGRALLGDGPAPDGTVVVGKVKDWESGPVAVEGGRYRNLLVAPPDPAYYGETVTFHMSNGVALETGTFDSRSGPKTQELDLHFSATGASSGGLPWGVVGGGLAVVAGVSLMVLVFVVWRPGGKTGHRAQR
ncbi:MAG: hypothetical protein HYY00_06785 [Chloroflexi bacterium]|nr:hypothetical protein [Chloroflexota bacterium]